MIYDTVNADQVEIGDQVLVNHDHVVVNTVLDEDDSVILEGYSEDTGEPVVYAVRYDTVVDLWEGLE